MSVIVGLIAAGGLVAAGFLLAFIWAVRTGQFDDTDTPPLRVLVDDRDERLSDPSHRGVSHVES
jgi:cbb3-type cytochrome oxidase maturation protein